MLRDIVADAGRSTPYTARSPACAMVAADDVVTNLGLPMKTLSSEQEEASYDDNTDRRAERAGQQ
jgi:hypothetical protein